MADKKYKLIFNLSDGSKQAVEFTAPQGPAGNGLDITGAVAGQTVKISAVDENGVPTAWEAVDISNSSQNGNGLTTEEKSLILGLFRNAAYTADMSATFAQLEAVWSDSGNGSGGEAATTYTVTYNMENATSSNPASVIANGHYFSTNIVANENYKIVSVTVTMGGKALDDAYNDGIVSIDAVTGDVVITVETENNLVNLFDESVTTDGSLYFGNGVLQGDAGMCVSDYIPVMSDHTYMITTYTSATYITGTNAVHFYDSEKNWTMARQYSIDKTTTPSTLTYQYTATEDGYIRCNVGKAFADITTIIEVQ